MTYAEMCMRCHCAAAGIAYLLLLGWHFMEAEPILIAASIYISYTGGHNA
jgi:hypothetical protein